MLKFKSFIKPLKIGPQATTFNQNLGFIHIFLHAKYEPNPTDPSRVMTGNVFNIKKKLIDKLYEKCLRTEGHPPLSVQK